MIFDVAEVVADAIDDHIPQALRPVVDFLFTAMMVTVALLYLAIGAVIVLPFAIFRSLKSCLNQL